MLADLYGRLVLLIMMRPEDRKWSSFLAAMMVMEIFAVILAVPLICAAGTFPTSCSFVIRVKVSSLDDIANVVRIPHPWSRPLDPPARASTDDLLPPFSIITPVLTYNIWDELWETNHRYLEEVHVHLESEGEHVGSSVQEAELYT